MSDFIYSGSSNWKLDQRYKTISNNIRKITGFGHQKVFLLGLIIGYKYGKKSDDFIDGGSEFRPSYFDNDEKHIINSVAYDLFGDQFIQEMNDEKFQTEFKKLCLLYFNGGMEIIIDRVFKDNMKDGQLLNSYTEYDTDLLRFMIDELEGVPF